jgi:serine O-acetyltransferase
VTSFLECFTVDLAARGIMEHSPVGRTKKLLYDVGYRVVVYYRMALPLEDLRFLRRFGRIFARLIRVRLSRIPGVEFRTRHPIGEGLQIYHPHDIVIGVGAVVGRNETIFNGVTLGGSAIQLREGDGSAEVNSYYPTIGDNVTIYPGAKIVGPVTIGSSSIIGANAVVNESFPENSIVAGVPAKLIRVRN